MDDLCVLAKNKLDNWVLQKYDDDNKYTHIFLFNKITNKYGGFIMDGYSYYNPFESQYVNYAYNVYNFIIRKWITLYLSLQCHFGELHHDLFCNIAIYYIPLYYLL